MNQNNRDKINHHETGPRFETGMDFYIPIGVILVELDSSNDSTRIETKNITENAVNNLMATLGEITE